MKTSEGSSECTFSVLLVEDEPKWQSKLHDLLCEASPKVKPLVKGSYKEAMQALAPQINWDLIVTDIGLPYEQPLSERTEEQKEADDKLMLGKKLCERAHERGIPCIVVTATGKIGKHPVSEAAQMKRRYKLVEVFSKVTLVLEDEGLFRTCIHDTLNSRLASTPVTPHVDGPAGSPSGWLDKVSIVEGVDTFTLTREHVNGSESFPIPSKYRLFFYLFVKKVAERAAHEPVNHRDANLALRIANDKSARGLSLIELARAFEVAKATGSNTHSDDDSPENTIARTSKKAEGGLRQAKLRLNDQLKELGTPRNGGDWIERGDGYYLNGSIDWVIVRKPQADPEEADDVGKPGRRHEYPTDPKTMEENTLRRGDRLPARRKGKTRQGERYNDD